MSVSCYSISATLAGGTSADFIYNGFLITDASTAGQCVGSEDPNRIGQTITGLADTDFTLLPPLTYPGTTSDTGNDNCLFNDGAGFLDFNGFSYDYSGSTDMYNIYFSAGIYSFEAGKVGTDTDDGDLDVIITPASCPTQTSPSSSFIPSETSSALSPTIADVLTFSTTSASSIETGSSSSSVREEPTSTESLILNSSSASLVMPTQSSSPAARPTSTSTGSSSMSSFQEVTMAFSTSQLWSFVGSPTTSISAIQATSSLVTTMPLSSSSSSVSLGESTTSPSSSQEGLGSSTFSITSTADMYSLESSSPSLAFTSSKTTIIVPGGYEITTSTSLTMSTSMYKWSNASFTIPEMKSRSMVEVSSTTTVGTKPVPVVTIETKPVPVITTESQTTPATTIENESVPTVITETKPTSAVTTETRTIPTITTETNSASAIVRASKPVRVASTETKSASSIIPGTKTTFAITTETKTASAVVMNTKALPAYTTQTESVVGTTSETKKATGLDSAPNMTIAIVAVPSSQEYTKILPIDGGVVATSSAATPAVITPKSGAATKESTFPLIESLVASAPVSVHTTSAAGSVPSALPTTKTSITSPATSAVKTSSSASAVAVSVPTVSRLSSSTGSASTLKSSLASTAIAVVMGIMLSAEM